MVEINGFIREMDEVGLIGMGGGIVVTGACNYVREERLVPGWSKIGFHQVQKSNPRSA